jgi:hypothetical protein
MEATRRSVHAQDSSLPTQWARHRAPGTATRLSAGYLTMKVYRTKRGLFIIMEATRRRRRSVPLPAPRGLAAAAAAFQFCAFISHRPVNMSVACTYRRRGRRFSRGTRRQPQGACSGRGRGRSTSWAARGGVGVPVYRLACFYARDRGAYLWAADQARACTIARKSIVIGQRSQMWYCVSSVLATIIK